MPLIQAASAGICKKPTKVLSFSLFAGFSTAELVAENHGQIIEVENTRYLLSQPWPYPSSLMIGCIAEAKSTTINLDENELEDAFWISKEQLIAELTSENPNIFPARRGAIAHLLISAWLKDEINQLNGN